MAKLIISPDAHVVQEVEPGAGRMSLGRDPHNDIVLDHQAVSAHHAAITRNGAGKTMSLVKPLTTLGSPGALVVVISRQADGYYMAQVQGAAVARLNEEAVVARRSCCATAIGSR